MEERARWHGFYSRKEGQEVQLTYRVVDDWMPYWSCWTEDDAPGAVMDCDFLEVPASLGAPNEERAPGWFLVLERTAFADPELPYGF